MKYFLQNQIDSLRRKELYRSLKTVESDQGAEIVYRGRRLINFSSNNYLGLANHPALKEAAVRAVKEYGTGSGASRLITGSMTLHEKLEKKIAEFKGTESALVFNSGYHANIGVITALMGEGDVIFSDELNHASLIDACRLSKARTFVYRHGDAAHLGELLNVGANLVFALREGDHKDRPYKKLIITDTIFSMDGDLAPLPQIMELAEKYDAWVFVDEAHATGVFGKGGRGIVEHFGIQIPPNPPLTKGGKGGFRLIQMGTLGKALGSFGAYVCGPRELIDFLINRSRMFIYTTSLPPSVLAASIAAIDLIQEDQSLKEKLWENVGYFRKRLEKIPPNPPLSKGGEGGFTPIIPLIIGSARRTMEIAEKLFESGIWATGIRPPTVKEGTSRIRLSLTAAHTRDHLDRLLDALSQTDIEKPLPLR